jgi:hypothetical protein
MKDIENSNTKDMEDAFEDCSATNVRNRLIEELMDMYLSDKSWYGRR